MQRIFFYCSLFCLFFSTGCTDSSPAETPTAAPGRADFYGGIELVTYRYLAQDRAMIEDFKQRYRINVNVTVLSPGEMLTRAQNNALTGDVVITPTLEDIVRLKSFKALQPFFVDAFTTGNVDERFMDDEGYYAALSRWTMVSIYNPKAVAEGEVTNYKGIAKLPLRGIRIGMAHPDSSGLAGVVSGLSRVVSNEGAYLWAKLMMEGAEGGYRGSDAQQLDRMMAGEIDLAFISHGAALRWFLNGDPQHFSIRDNWRIKFPRTETDNVNFMNLTCVGVISNAPNRARGLQFVDYLFQKEVQEKMAEAIFEYPAEVYSEKGDYLSSLMEVPGRQVVADELEQNLPIAWELINRIAAGE